MFRSFAYFGTPYPARDTLAYLLKHGYRPDVVVTNPDARQGRGQRYAPSPTKVLAEEHSIRVITPDRLDDISMREIMSFGCEFGIVVAYGTIIPTELLEDFPYGMLNVHYSLLPKYRGASPVEAALLQGEKKTGVTIQRIAPELDAGDILAQTEVQIHIDDTARELRPRLVRTGAELLLQTLPKYELGHLSPVPQDHSKATYAPKLKKPDGELDLNAPGLENWNKYRAYAEWPGTYFFVEKNGTRTRVKINKATLGPNDTFVPLRVTPEGKKEMDYTDFMRSLS